MKVAGGADQGRQPGSDPGTDGRTAWIDAVKGLGIILVVLGHMRYPPGDISSLLKNSIYLFHMPLFFFMSGWTYRKKPFLISARTQTQRILIPYVSFLVLIVVADLVATRLFGMDSFTNASGWPKFIAKLLLGGAALNTPLSVFWFLTCLFATAISYNLLYREDQAPFRGWNLVLAFGALGLAFGFSEVARWGVVGRAIGVNPLGLFSVPAAIVFFHFGNAASNDPARVLPWMPALALVALVLRPEVFDMKYVKFGNLSNFLVALAICAAIVLVLRNAAPAITRPLAGLGRASLVIMALHVSVIHYAEGHWAFLPIFLAALVLPLAAYAALNRFAATRVLFLGARE